MGPFVNKLSKFNSWARYETNLIVGPTNKGLLVTDRAHFSWDPYLLCYRALIVHRPRTIPFPLCLCRTYLCFFSSFLLPRLLLLGTKQRAQERERERVGETIMESEPTRVMVAVNESTLRGYPHASISSKKAFEWTLKKIVRSNTSGFKLLLLHVQVQDEDGYFSVLVSFDC